MAIWAIPVVVGFTHNHEPVERLIGTFTGESDANDFGAALKKAGKVKLVHPAQQLMTSREFDAYLAAIKVANTVPGVRKIDEPGEHRKD